MTDTFDPIIISGVVDEAGSLRLHRPFTSNEFFDIGTAGVVNESEILREVRCYDFRLWITDRLLPASPAFSLTSVTAISTSHCKRPRNKPRVHLPNRNITLHLKTQLQTSWPFLQISGANTN